MCNETDFSLRFLKETRGIDPRGIRRWTARKCPLHHLSRHICLSAALTTLNSTAWWPPAASSAPRSSAADRLWNEAAMCHIQLAEADVIEVLGELNEKCLKVLTVTTDFEETKAKCADSQIREAAADRISH